METKKCRIVKESKNIYLEFDLDSKKARISLTEDKPNEIKKVFNMIILNLKKGNFIFELEQVEENLFSLVSKEYIKQLNAELNSVFLELKDYELLEK
ncbi:MAG: hypothetical protein SCJ93_14440 [Bacillota bacterium]|nr:hypothetical protein [Bacillota bacterium]